MDSLITKLLEFAMVAGIAVYLLGAALMLVAMIITIIYFVQHFL